MNLKSVESADVSGKRVLLRVDFNVPLDKETHEIEDDSRIHSSLPTIQHLLDNGARIIIVSHLGRPKGKVADEFSLSPAAKRLGEILKKEIKLIGYEPNDEMKKEVESMSDGDIVMLENIRFNAGEKENDPEFSKQLASLADVFVNDGFAISHRAHASVAGVGKILPAYAGLTLIKECEALTHALEKAEHPVCFIVGGAKIDTKIGVIKKFLDKADSILVGGALANTFLAARGFEMGESKYEKDKLDVAREIMLEAEKQHETFKIPRDVVVASELTDDAERIDLPVEDVEGDMKIFDIGNVTVKRYVEVIKESKTVIWNGPLGVHEYSGFANASKQIAEAIVESDAMSIIGGGDTVDFLKRYGFDFEKFSHVSMGGGAMIEFLEGKMLPGIEIVMQ